MVRGGKAEARRVSVAANVSAVLATVSQAAAVEEQGVEAPKFSQTLPGRRRNALLGALCFTSPLANAHGAPAIVSQRSSVLSSAASSGDDSLSPERGLPDVVAGVKESVEAFLENGEVDEASERSFREAKYAKALLSFPGIEELSAKVGLYEDMLLQDVARLFAEYDVGLGGFIPQHDTTTIFRRLGREVDCKDVFELIERLFADKFGIMRRDDLDFLDIVEIVGHQAQRDHETLRNAYEKLRGFERSLRLGEVAKTLEPLHLHPRLEQLKRIASDLRILGKGEQEVELTQAELLLKIGEQCRELEKQRVSERAGFSHEQVMYFKDAFEKVAESPGGEVDQEGLCEVLAMIKALPEDAEGMLDLEELMKHADTNDNGLWSFDECLHLLRRFYDKEEYAAVVEEHKAAEEAGLSREDHRSLRGLYHKMLQDDEEFTYYLLTKAIRFLLETSITVEQNAVLQGVFRSYAKPSKAQHESIKRHSGQELLSQLEAFQLSLPGFLRVIGRLWHDDLLGSSDRPKSSDSSPYTPRRTTLMAGRKSLFPMPRTPSTPLSPGRMATGPMLPTIV